MDGRDTISVTDPFFSFSRGDFLSSQRFKYFLGNACYKHIFYLNRG